MSSNTSSVNEISSYQQNENHTNIESSQKCKENFDSMDGNTHRFSHRNEIEEKTTLNEALVQESRLNDESFHDKSENLYGEKDDYMNVQNKIHKDKDRSKYSKNSIIENQELPSCRLNREPVPGAPIVEVGQQQQYLSLIHI